MRATSHERPRNSRAIARPRARGDGQADSRADQAGVPGDVPRRIRRLHLRRHPGQRTRLAGIPRQLALLQHHRFGRGDVRRGAAHHHRALVALDHPHHGGLRRLPAVRVRRPAVDDLRRQPVRLPVVGPAGHRRADSREEPVPRPRVLLVAFHRRDGGAGAPAGLVRLDVGAPRRGRVSGGRRLLGGGHPCGDAPRLPRRAPRAALHAQPPGQAGRRHGPAVRLRLVRAGVGPLDVARLSLLQHDVRLARVHGRLAGGPHDLQRPGALVQRPSRRARPDHREAISRHRQALLRVHGVLGLPGVFAVPGDLVRQPARGDALLHAAPHRRVEAGDAGRGGADVRAAVLRPVEREGQDVDADDDVLRGVLVHRRLAGALHRGVSVDLRADGRGHGAARQVGAGALCRFPRRVRLVVRAVHGRLPQDARLPDDLAVP